MTRGNDGAALDAALTRHLTAITQGDRAAFAALYDLTSAKLYGVAVRVVGDREIAADVVQEAYLTVWRRAAKFDRAKGPALTWLAVIVRNQGIDVLRKKTPVAVADEVLAGTPDDGPPPDAAVASGQAARLVRDAMAALPENMHRALALSYLHDLSIAEVAAELDAPANTVKSWLRRGLARLHRELPADAREALG